MFLLALQFSLGDPQKAWISLMCLLGRKEMQVLCTATWTQRMEYWPQSEHVSLPILYHNDTSGRPLRVLNHSGTHSYNRCCVHKSQMNPRNSWWQSFNRKIYLSKPLLASIIFDHYWCSDARIFFHWASLMVKICPDTLPRLFFLAGSSMQRPGPEKDGTAIYPLLF